MWYIVIQGKTEGPFSFLELRKDSRITPDTFVWKEGFDSWKRIKDVPELDKLFEKEENPSQNNDEEPGFKKEGDDEIVIDTSLQPPIFTWTTIAFFLLLYYLIQLIWK